MQTEQITSTVFEPHGGYGKRDPDGNPYPLGYISTEAHRGPVIELNPVTFIKLPYSRAELRSLALKMAAASEMYAALINLLDDGDKVDREQAMRILRKARGES